MTHFLMRQHKIFRATLILPLLFFLIFLLLETKAFSFPPVLAAPMAQTGPEVEFAAGSTQSVTEENVTISLNVEVSAAPSTTVTVDYVVIAGTATQSSDYSGSTSGTLTFPASATTDQVISINIVEDSLSENSETFSIVLQDVISGTLGSSDTAVITIVDDDPTPTPTGAAVIFADGFEPNDNFSEASDIVANAGETCNLTVWPIGDIDYFRFVVKGGANYTVETDNLSVGLDTVLSVYDANLNLIGTNDDSEPPDKASRVSFTASSDGFYYAQVTNRDPTDPTNKTYCIEVIELTPNASPTPPLAIPGEADACEFNSTIETACLLIAGETLSGMNFVPSLGSEQDTDIYRLSVKTGLFYTCETIIESGSAADTNLILKDANGNDFIPNIGNDDRELGDFSSEVSYFATYTGWLHIIVGPRIAPMVEEADLHEYSIMCTQIAATATPTPFPTFPPSTGGGGGGSLTPTETPTPFEFPTPLPTPTPIDFTFLTPEAPESPVIDIQPLPTETPEAGIGGQSVSVGVNLYYDANGNGQYETIEGIVDAAVALYDNTTGQLIAFGYTNESGLVQFTDIQTSGAVRVVVPFINYSQIIAGIGNDVVIRVAPQPLPGDIP
ncbi:MAG: Calx-beta domain-containing protein [Chloroflexota bacterium]